MITKRQFDLLVLFAEDYSTHALSQRDIALKTDMSVGSVNSTIKKLNELGYLEDTKITSAGYEVLEQHRVKRAVFIAAGFGSRLVPITLNTPKPLIRVNHVRIIDTMLDAVLSAGIYEIYIVRGYLSEQFDQLLYKYPMIKFIENPAFNESNNISSAYCARYLFKNAYILEGDLLLHNPKLITRYQYESNYLGEYKERTDDWCFHLDNNYIKKVAIGGLDCYQMYGISYWTEEDGARLVKHIESVYESPGGKERFWDQVPLEYHINEYKIAVRNCSSKDIVEIDTFSELKALDQTYEVR